MSLEEVVCYDQCVLLVSLIFLKRSLVFSILLFSSGSDHELLIAKFRLKLKKVWKTSRPFRYDLNQIPYDHTVEVTNRFKGLDLIDRVPEELLRRFMTLDRGQ